MVLLSTKKDGSSASKSSICSGVWIAKEDGKSSKEIVTSLGIETPHEVMDKKTKVDNTKYDFVFIRKHYHILNNNKRSVIAHAPNF